MKKLAFPLSIGALAVLGACATYEPATPAPVVITQPAPVVTAPAGTVVVPPVAQTPVVVPQTAALRAGHGRIEAISAVPQTGSASTGASAPSYRLAVKMDDGTLQYVDTSATNLAVGDRIEFTQDGYIRR